ncbi:hypothetical protein [Encephalitozoon cuniculi GB-M1]|uniref:Uncharacterized protein n=2 Tax=Encephalitozoon cuniculi TaxID=6035 RepID=Q8SVI5_ENCCU|nr:uncharacterized protein ECU05_1090 [Encephalitozoon cuniculi GB-M1]AGE95473.1 hypothetical protein ECU05_1090 [Encephalitozoon cuniculi]KMV66166.1 hypothetical protein M970_051090 [Encephalitozoon cuniculi EcunIII-L]UYI27904.1 hypothetical protein J0A71_08g17930 [Encephalitozoon cuniculi]CAD26629.1 hypothetical protein [Encephalitozoon cuniculi GB-M1]
MNSLLAGLLLASEILCFSQEIISTNCSKGIIRYTTTHRSPHLLAVEYPSNVIPHLISTPVYRIIEEKLSTIVIFRLEGKRVLNVPYEKNLCRVWECSPYIDEGVVIKAVGAIGNRVVWKDSVVDWVVIPDFTMQFVAFNSFGILLTLIMKVYCDPENVFQRTGGPTD